MKKTALVFVFCLVGIILSGQTLDFGIEVQQNTNDVKKWETTEEYSELNRAFSIQDINDDTLNIYFNSFSMVNNFEIPLYFRFNFKQRWYLDLKLSNVSQTLNMEGYANFNDGYFQKNFGSYSDFIAQANASGFMNADSTDYLNYLNGAKSQSKFDVKSREEVRMLCFTANLGIRLLPHRSIHPYVSFGFTAKANYRKFRYDYLSFNSSTVYNLAAVNEGVNRFDDRTYYLTIGAGLEFYRFRAGFYYQGGTQYNANSGKLNEVVINVNPKTPFERIHSYGFVLSANLFSTTLGKTKVKPDLSGNQIILSNVEHTRYKWEWTIRFNRRVFNDISSFYKTNNLTLVTRDSILYNDGASIKQAEKVQSITFGDLKRISWSGQFDFAVQRNIGKRFAVEAMLGFSNLTTDIATTEMSGTVIYDTASVYWLQHASEPRIRSGVYRNRFAMSNFSLSLSYKIIRRDLFSLALFYGMGTTSMFHQSSVYVDFPDGVNELEIYGVLDENYYNLDNTAIYAYNGNLNPDFNESPQDYFNALGNTKLDRNWPTPKPQRSFFPSMRAGFEIGIDRFTLGMTLDRTLYYMDGFLLDKYTSVYFSIGYKWRRR